MAATVAQERGSAKVFESPRGFRRDIQGLRAVAVTLVLLFHAGVPGFSGGYVGVDVFFVLSGFLITGIIAEEVDRTGRLDLPRFYGRRVRRLLPAAALTTVGVAVLTVLVLPVTRWADVAGDIAASSLYVVNWRLADRAVDYMAADEATSPLQHFWSLAIEEQFYIVWPALLAALLLLLRRRMTRRVLASLLGVILVSSFSWSVVATAADGDRAYLITTTRVWEFAAGALLAGCAGSLARLGRPIRLAAGWVGLGIILAAGMLFTPGTPFPGVAALLPVLGAVLVLAAGLGDGTGELKVLTFSPMQDVGALSYSLYLWHWPLIVVAAARWGGDDGQLSISRSVLVVAAGVVPAWLSYKLVERPIHISRRIASSLRATAGVGLVAVGLGLASAYVVHSLVPEVRRLDASEAPGAAALVRSGDGWRDSTLVALEDVVPGPADAHDSFDWTCETTRIGSASMDECELFGENEGHHVAAVGDSHLQHWLPAIRETARVEGWRLTVYVMQGCPLISVDIPFRDAPFVECAEWNRKVQQRLAERGFDVIIVGTLDRSAAYEAGELLKGDKGRDVLVRGYVEAWTQASEHSDRFVVIRSTPRSPVNPPECLAEASESIEECAFESPDVETAGAVTMRAARGVVGADLLDMNDLVCPWTPCPAVVGGVLIYRDRAHLTSAYVETLAPMFADRLVGILEDEPPV